MQVGRFIEFPWVLHCARCEGGLSVLTGRSGVRTGRRKGGKGSGERGRDRRTQGEHVEESPCLCLEWPQHTLLGFREGLRWDVP